VITKWKSGARPLAIDLFCGLGGWAEGLLWEGYQVVGFDIEAHRFREHKYPARLVIQNVLDLHGEQFSEASLIVASPPCQAYSYRAMPWKRAKALPPPDNTLFLAPFRIQQEASAAAGRHIPLVVENVRGAQAWVGPADGHFSSYYFWGDVPPLPMQSYGDAKQGGDWFQEKQSISHFSSKSPRRRAGSAIVAKIPLALARHIAHFYYPKDLAVPIFTVLLSGQPAVQIVRPDADSRGWPPYSRAKVCPVCLDVWAIIRKDGSQEAFSVEGHCCAGCKSQLPSVVPGSLLDLQASQTVDWDLIDYLPPALKQREFDLHVKHLENSPHGQQAESEYSVVGGPVPPAGSECPSGGAGGHWEDLQYRDPPPYGSGDFLPESRDGVGEPPGILDGRKLPDT
jgi:hypothetical protein